MVVQLFAVAAVAATLRGLFVTEDTPSKVNEEFRRIRGSGCSGSKRGTCKSCQEKNFSTRKDYNYLEKMFRSVSKRHKTNHSSATAKKCLEWVPKAVPVLGDRGAYNIMSVCLSVCLSACLSVYLSIYLCLSVCLSVCLNTYSVMQ